LLLVDEGIPETVEADIDEVQIAIPIVIGTIQLGNGGRRQGRPIYRSVDLLELPELGFDICIMIYEGIPEAVKPYIDETQDEIAVEVGCTAQPHISTIRLFYSGQLGQADTHSSSVQ